MAYTILIFDNRPDNVQTLSSVIRNKFSYNTIVADSAEYGVDWVVSGRQPWADVVIIDFTNFGPEVLRIISKIKAAIPQLPVIVLMQYGNDDYAVPAIAAGANDFLIKPVSIERLRLSMQNALKIRNLNNAVVRLEQKNTGYVSFSDLVGNSEAFKKALHRAKEVACTDLPVWIEGEQGTGRESMARAIHGSSKRAGKPFIFLNCKDINQSNAEILLFGTNESGLPFPPKTGMLQAANCGTIYFNEISYLSLALQQRLNTFLDPNLLATANIRIICSNSRDISDAPRSIAANRSFLDELRTFTIALPPLSNRKTDIAVLAQHFLNVFAASENRFPAILSEDAIKSLEERPWPGNVRQLANLLHRVVLLSQLDEVDAATLRLMQQLEPVNYSLNKSVPTDAVALFDRKGQVKKLRSIENEAIQLALKYANGCMTRAARNLGIGRSTLYRKIDEMGAAAYMPLENQTTRPIMPASAGELS